MTEIKTYTLEELQALDNNYTEVDLVVKNTNLLQEQSVEILLEAPSLQEDKRVLIPIKYKDKYGFRGPKINFVLPVDKNKSYLC